MIEKLADAGVGTIIGMHMGQELRDEADKHNMHVIIAGHMSSDSVGINLFLDELERHGVKTIADAAASSACTATRTARSCARSRARCRRAERLRRAAAPGRRRGPDPSPMSTRPAVVRERSARRRAAGAGRRAARSARGPGRRRRRRLLRPRALERARLRRQLRGRRGVVEAVDLAHLYDARAYLALNTLLKDDEVGPALAALEAPYLAGLDALIVADLGFALQVRRAYPGPAAARQHAGRDAQLLAAGRARPPRLLARRAGARAEPRGDRRARRARPGARGLRPRRPVLRLLGRLPALQHGRRPQRQPRALQPVLPSAVHDEPRPAAASGRAAAAPTPPSQPRHVHVGPRGHRRPAAARGRRRDVAQDRGPHEGRGVRGRHHRRVPGGARRRPGGPRGYAVRPEWRRSLEQSFSRSFTTAHLEGRHHEVRSGGRGGHRGVLVGRVATRRRGATARSRCASRSR